MLIDLPLAGAEETVATNPDIQQCLRSYVDYEEIKAGILKKKRKYAC